MHTQSPSRDQPAGFEADGTPYWIMTFGGVTTARRTRKVHGRRPGDPTHLEQARAYLALTPEERARYDASFTHSKMVGPLLPIGSRFD